MWPHRNIYELSPVLSSISWEQNAGKCRRLNLRDEEDPETEVRTRQLLGLDIGRK